MHEFKVWAPRVESKISVGIGERTYPMEGPSAKGYWKAVVEEAGPGTEYAFLIDDDPARYPDPRSLSQPQGVHGPSQVLDQSSFAWTDKNWQGRPLGGAVIYEVHIGTFTISGTFDAAIARLPYLAELGVTHIEVMPVAEWAGNRGWGYDGVDLFATTWHYGGPAAFKRFIDAAHGQGLAVLLDVVYNHFGPIGNYVGNFGPYLSARHHTPWGDAVNFEEAGSDEVRRFFCDNALMWLRDFHMDGLRLDAVHEFVDRSAIHFMEQLSAEVENLASTVGRRLVLIGESDLNDPRIIRSREAGGYGLDAQWSDDFHHSLFTLLHAEPEEKGYYRDFGAMECLAKSLKNMFVFEGGYSTYRGRSHGRPVEGLSAHHFVGFIQNHDQVGNRATGDRIEHIVRVQRTKLALGLVLTAPFLPMLFMGEEYAASTPFLYFADHEDAAMAKLVSEGRKKEFAAFGFDAADIPDPEAPSTFSRSKLNWEEIKDEKHAEVLDWTRELIAIRRKSISLNDGDLGHLQVFFSEGERWLRMDRGKISVLMNLGEKAAEFRVDGEDFRLLLASDPATALKGGSVGLPPDGFALLSAERD